MFINRFRSSSSNLARSLNIPRNFTTTTKSLIELKSQNKPSLNKPLKITSISTATSNADALADVLETLADFPDAPEDVGSLLNNLKPNTVVSPSSLSPSYLLQPYLPRPNFALAYPLGPPVSTSKTHDPFKNLNLNPLSIENVMNPYLTSEFCTSMGKIKGRGLTGLQRGTQRGVGKAVRRARSMGLIPTFGKSLPSYNGTRKIFR